MLRIVKVKQPGLIAALVRIILLITGKGGKFGHVAILDETTNFIHDFNFRGHFGYTLEEYLELGNKIEKTSYEINSEKGFRNLVKSTRNGYNILYNLRIFFPYLNIKGDNCVSRCCKVFEREELSHKSPDFFN